MPHYDITILGNAPVDALFIDISVDELKKAQCTLDGWTKVSPDTLAQLTHQATLHSLQAGGAAANTAYNMGKLGGRVHFVGAYSDDEFGNLFKASMDSANIESLPAKAGGRSLLINAFITTNHQGKVQRTFATTGSDRHINADDITEETIRNSGMVLAEAYLFNDAGQNEAVEKAFNLARQHGTPTALSLAAKDVVRNQTDTISHHIRQGLDLLIANEAEMAILLNTARKRHADHGHDLLHAIRATPTLITRGKEGAEFRHPRYGATFVECPPLPAGAKAVDPTGAGDSFLAAFLHGYIANAPVRECLRQGHRLAGQVVQQVGARLPTINRETVVVQRESPFGRTDA